jgi:hypothetical protein
MRQDRSTPLTETAEEGGSAIPWHPPEQKRAIQGFQKLHIASAACRISETISVSRTSTSSS